MEEDISTQIATQQFLDPRRIGLGNSGLEDEDLTDVFCILHPASAPAYKAMGFIHANTPQHTISADNTSKDRPKAEGPHPEGVDNDTANGGPEDFVSCDIALRLSANLKSNEGGFLFGRNTSRCDIVIGRDDQIKRVSNVHFRIYINEYGIIMLEDRSTNGTLVDGHCLCIKDKENGPNQRILELGSIVCLVMTPPEADFRFIVRIPQRDDEAEHLYQKNLTNYFCRINQAQKEMQAKALQNGLQNGDKNGDKTQGILRRDTTQDDEITQEATRPDPPNIFAQQTPDFETPRHSLTTSRLVKEWKGGAKYKKVQTIGKGAFAVVYLITDRFDGTPYAAKELEKRRFMKNGVLDQKVDQEMRIMQKIKHPNIVRFVEHIDWEEYLYIIMEYIPGGDLGTLVGRGGPLQEAEAKIVSEQLVSALKYLHGENITHRDVKPDNILIKSTSPFNVRLTDFGLSKMVDTQETFLRTFCGTLLYCAPEVYTEYREYDYNGRRIFRGVDKRYLPEQRYDHAVDIWSLAGVIFYALTGNPPYPAKNGIGYLDLLHQIMTQPLDIRPLQYEGVSEPGIRFIKSMLHTRPEYRATVTELENSSWFGGIDSQEMSYDEDEEDEVDMVRGYDPSIEEGASQLSLNELDDVEIRDSQDNISDLTEIQQPEIPASFETSDGDSYGNESYGFMAAHSNPANGRLFGEVDVSAIGSSGAFPLEKLTVPRTARKTPSLTDSEVRAEAERLNLAGSWASMPPPAHLPTDRTSENGHSGHQGYSPSSLMGAESMVGHLNMQSPSAESPASDQQSPPQMTTRDIHHRRVPRINEGNWQVSESLRRRRDDQEDDLVSELNGGLMPSDLPATKRRKSAREIDIKVPASVFWDPKDKSTHHSDYPSMSYSNYKTFQDFAAKQGQTFAHGGDVFETTMQTFRSPSAEATDAQRAMSEPGNVGAERTQTRRDTALPDTAHGSNEPKSNLSMLATNGSFEMVGNDFQPPKRVLAKVLSLSDSCLPTISLNVTESITSWGRGYKNTIRYSNGQESRVPKYAFKIFLFKPDFYPTNAIPGNEKNNSDQDMTFYISSKASNGISINTVKLPSFDCKNPGSASKYWGKLHHGDIITVWHSDNVGAKTLSFQFECYWGLSKEPRPAGQKFVIFPSCALLNELEIACLAEEQSTLAEIDRREREDKEVASKATEDARQMITLEGTATDDFAERPATAIIPAPHSARA